MRNEEEEESVGNGEPTKARRYIKEKRAHLEVGVVVDVGHHDALKLLACVTVLEVGHHRSVPLDLLTSAGADRRYVS
jgi:hypothetical protein